MKKKLLQMTAILSSALLLSGCTLFRSGPVSPAPLTSQQTTYEAPSSMGDSSVSLTAGKTPGMVISAVPTEEQMTQLSDAGTDLLAQVMSNSGENENVLLSPTSILMAIGMTENGADGKTLEEMENIANGGVSKDSLNMVMAYLSKKMEASADTSWNVANSIWLKDIDDLELDDKFAETVLAHYQAEVWKSAFDQGTVDDINGWVDRNTNGMIDKIIDSIPDNAMMYLINAIAFEGEWEKQYEDTQVREGWVFNNADGTDTDVIMLASTENRYFELGDGEGFVKNYKGGEFAFVAILPKEGESTKEYLSKIRDKNLDFAKAVREASNEEVIVKIPEFDADYKTELSDAYKALGMNEPFGENANLSKMMADGRDDLYIGRILHKTHIEVDRKGTKAAAVTAVEIQTKGMLIEDIPKEITLDRPFVYAIVDNSTGLPIFLGCQNSMIE